MKRSQLYRTLRTFVWLLLFLSIPAVLGLLYWANQTGLPSQWRSTIESEIGNHGVYVEIGFLTYRPLRGFVAEDIRIFAEPEKIKLLSTLESVRLTLDNTKLASGQLDLKMITLLNSDISIPVDPKQPAGKTIDLSAVNGTIRKLPGRLLEIKDTTANIGGIDISLDAKVFSKTPGSGPPDDEFEGRRRALISNILDQIQLWTFHEKKPPKLKLQLRGDFDDRSTLRSDFLFTTESAEKNGFVLNDIQARGRLNGYLLSMDQLRGRDRHGKLEGHFDYQLIKKNGRFDIISSIDLLHFAEAWLGKQFNNRSQLPVKTDARLSGQVDLSDLGKPLIDFTGHLDCGQFSLRGITVDRMKTWVSYQKGDIFLEDIFLQRQDKIARAKLLIDKEEIRIALSSDFPTEVYAPLFEGKPLGEIINKFTQHTGAETKLSLEGTIQRNDPRIWQYAGSGQVKNISYNKVPIFSAECSFDLDHKRFDFFDGDVIFNYSDYSLRKKFAGPTSGRAKLGRIAYDREEKLVSVEQVEGTVWAAPLTRLFAGKIADRLEAYQFHTPPQLAGNGIVDVTPQGRTNLKISLVAPGNSTYRLLGKEILLSEPSANIHIDGRLTKVQDLKAKTMGGLLKGQLTNQSGSGLRAEIGLTDLDMSAISSTYGMKMDRGGKLTGRIEFDLPPAGIRDMSGRGVISLDKAELFSVPVFGPLSSVISKILDDRRAGFERVKYAFCSFAIQNGILRTHDFQTATNSVNFTGNGEVNLIDQSIDFTMRLNTRGLLGLITRPLRPFSGIFQFHGTGPIRSSKWENVRVTPPPPEQEKALLRKVPKAIVIPE